MLIRFYQYFIFYELISDHDDHHGHDHGHAHTSGYQTHTDGHDHIGHHSTSLTRLEEGVLLCVLMNILFLLVFLSFCLHR